MKFKINKTINKTFLKNSIIDYTKKIDYISYRHQQKYKHQIIINYEHAK